MQNKTIRVVATVTALADKTTAAQAILQQIITPTRQERGCLNYQLLRNKDNPAEFLFIEEWIDKEAMEAHLTTPHVQEALANVMPLLAMVPHIQKYDLLV